MAKRIPKWLTDRARRLRNEPTDAESALRREWSRYRPKFTRELSLKPDVIDLARQQLCDQARR